MSEFAFPATLTQSAERSSVIAFNPAVEGAIHIADSTHPNWTQILFGLRSGDNRVWELFDIAGGIMTRFQQITDRVAFNGTDVLWDGDPVHSTLANQLSRAISDGNPDNYLALARFWEKLAANPSEHSRTQAYDWLASHAFQITNDGDVVGYKRVYPVADEPGLYESGYSSQVPDVPSAFVNGKAFRPLSKVRQRVGDTVSMPRSEVCHDPSKPCERGLHVATLKYLGGAYGRSTTLRVFCNPTHIVSVPTDSSGGKIRVCNYTIDSVLDDNFQPTTEPVLSGREPGYHWAGDVSSRL